MPVLRRLHKRETDFELIWLAILSVLFAVGGTWLTLDLPTPKCVFRQLTGLPCLTCGGTRCLESMLHGNTVAAVAWNPLVFVCAGFASLFVLYAFVVVVFRLPRVRLTHVPARHANMLRVAVVVAAATNWIYLIWRFSR